MASRTLLIFAAVTALLATIGLSGGSIARAADIAYVATDALNVRDVSSADGSILDELQWGEVVTIVAGPTENGWFEVVNGDSTGWVDGEHLSWQPVGAFDGSNGVGAVTGRWIDVDRSSGTVTLYHEGEAVGSYVAALGWELTDDGYYATANGTYEIYAKNADLTWSEPAQVFLTQWVAFDPERANGFHSFSMDEEGNVTAGLGTPTGGCVALEPSDAAELFAFAEVGMTVEVHW